MNVVLDASVSTRAKAIQRELRAGRFVPSDEGILVPDLKLKVGGHFTINVNGGPDEISPNRVVNEGLDHLLDVTLRSATQITTWYVALFAGNVTPAATWTAANFTSLSTEFINYDESTRPEYVEAAVSSQSITNLASRAVFTISTGGGTVYGASIISASAKSATTGKLFSATRFASARTLDATDVLNVAYTISASST